MGSIILVPILLLLLINSTATTDSIASANSTATTTITTTQNPTTDSTASTDSTISTDTTITANPTPTTPTTATTVSTISTAIPITADTTPTTPTTATTDSTISTATTIVAAPTTTAPPTTTTDSTISTATTIAAAPTSTVPPTTTADSTISTATTITADPTPTTPTTATTVSTISTATPITADTTPTTPTTATTGSTISTATTITIDATATTESTPPTSSADSTTDSTITPTTTPNMTPKPTTPRPTLPPGKEAPNFDGKYMNVSSSMKWKNGWHADLDKKESQIYRETKTDIEDQINIISKDAKGFKQSEVFGFKQCSTYTMFLTQEAGYTTDAFVAEFKLSYGLRDCVENPAEVSDNMTSTLAGLCTINITVDGKDGTVDQAYFNKTTSAPIKSAADDVKNDTIRADMVCGNNVCPRTSDCTLVGTLVDCHDKCAAKGEVDPQCIKDFENFPGSEDLAVCYLSEDDEGNYKPYCGCKPTAYNTGKYCLNMWWIIGPTVGGAVLLILIFTIVIIVVSRKRKSPQPTPDTLFADGMPME